MTTRPLDDSGKSRSRGDRAQIFAGGQVAETASSAKASVVMRRIHGPITTVRLYRAREIGVSRRRLLASAPQPRRWSRAAPEAAARSQAVPQGGLSAGQYDHQEIQPSRDGYRGIVC